jgi:hypothetical protein
VRRQLRLLLVVGDAGVGALAVHLRAATTMRPGVPQRLASILHDLNEALTDLVERGAV